MDENQNDYSYGDDQNRNVSGNQNDNQNGYADGNQNTYNKDDQNMYTNGNQNGYQYNNQPYAQYPQEPQGNRGMAIASLVVGIFSILCCCCSWLGAILGVVGILLAFFSKPKEGKFEGVALGGLICAIVGLVLAVVMIIVNFFIVRSPGYAEMMDAYMQQLAPLLQDYQ